MNPPDNTQDTPSQLPPKFEPEKPSRNTDSASSQQSVYPPSAAPLSPRKRSTWTTLLTVFGTLQIIMVCLVVAFLVFAFAVPFIGIFIALLYFAYGMPVVLLVALATAVVAVLYLVKHGSRDGKFAFAVVSLVISLGLLGSGAYTYYQLRVSVSQRASVSTQESLRKSKDYQRQYTADNPKPNQNPGITKEVAVDSMRNCKIDYFVGYTDIALVKDANTKAWLQKAEQSTSGIEMFENKSVTYIFASKLMTVELQDTARQFRQACYGTKKLYVAVDDWIETEYPIGTWKRVKQ